MYTTKYFNSYRTALPIYKSNVFSSLRRSIAAWFFLWFSLTTGTKFPKYQHSFIKYPIYKRICYMRSSNAQNFSNKYKPNWVISHTSDAHQNTNAGRHSSQCETKSSSETNKKSSSIANISASYCVWTHMLYAFGLFDQCPTNFRIDYTHQGCWEQIKARHNVNLIIFFIYGFGIV